MPKFRGGQPRQRGQGDSASIVQWAQSFVAGLDSRDPSLTNDPNTVAELDGFDIIDGEIRKAPGTVLFGDDSAAWKPASVHELVLSLHDFVTSDGTLLAIGHSKTNHAYYKAATDAWVDVTGTATGGGTTLDFYDATTGYTDALPGGTALDPDAKIYCAVNGVDTDIFIWDGDTALTFESLSPTVGGTAVGGRYITYFNNRLIMLDVTEGGTNFASRIRWCASGDMTDWDGIGAGANDISTVQGQGRGLVVAGNRAFAMFDRGIIEIRPTNNSAAPFSFTPMSTAGLGLWSPRSIAATPTGQRVFMSNDLNLYLWDPADPIRGNPQPIGTQIVEQIRLDIDRGKHLEVWGTYNPEANKYILGIARTESSYADVLYSFDFDTGSWSRRTLPRGIIAAHPVAPTLIQTINALTGDINSLGAVTINSLAGSDLPIRTAVSMDTRPQTVGGSDVSGSRILSFEQGNYTLGFEAITVESNWVTCDTTEGVDTTWTNPSNVTALDGALAKSDGTTNMVGIGTAGGISAYKGGGVDADYGWGGSENIVGIQVRLHGYGRSDDATPSERDVYIHLMDGTGAISTTANYFTPATVRSELMELHYNDDESFLNQVVGVTQKSWLLGTADNNFNSLTGLTPGTVLANLGLGIVRKTATTFEATKHQMNLDSVEWSFLYEGLTELEAYTSSLKSNAFDFELPDKLKALSTVVILYRDLSAEPTQIRLTVSPDDNLVYTGSTAGLNDRLLKRLVFRPMVTASTFSLNVSHSDTKDIAIIGFEAHASVVGNAIL